MTAPVDNSTLTRRKNAKPAASLSKNVEAKIKHAKVARDSKESQTKWILIGVKACLLLSFVHYTYDPIGHAQTYLKWARADRFERMMIWTKENGGKLDKFELRQYTDTSDYRGIHATSFIRKGEVAFHIPREILITPELVKDTTTIGEKLAEVSHHVRISNHTYIAIFLVEERQKGDDSKWAPYINVLPKVCQHVQHQHIECVHHHVFVCVNRRSIQCRTTSTLSSATNG